MNNLTLGSLFSGSGGFELAGLNCGITPRWASEVEPFAIAVTRARLPQVRHLGDICNIDGSTVEPVDIITGGSPCTDVSCAGRREGLIDGSQSKLFFEMIRIVREMLEATGNMSPRYLIFENVPGLLSSNRGADFKRVMDEFRNLGFIADPNILDAQDYGVSQRRKRIYIACVNRRFFNAADYPADAAQYRDNRMQRAIDTWGGETFAGIATRRHEPVRQKLSEILQTNVPQRFYLSAKACIGILRRAENRGKQLPSILKVALESQGSVPLHPNAPAGAGRGTASPLGFEPGACSRLGGHVWSERVGALRADAGDNQTSVVYDVFILK